MMQRTFLPRLGATVALLVVLAGCAGDLSSLPALPQSSQRLCERLPYDATAPPCIG